MKITALETLQLSEFPRLLWVLVHTDADITGLGETYDKAGPACAVVHDLLGELLIGRDPREIEPLWQTMFGVTNYHGYAGAELRAISAVDMALWDILGQWTGQPIWRLLGGRCRDEVRLYNTCIGYRQFRDRDRFLSEPGALAQELLAQGIRAMKIWPFDGASEQSGGHYLEPGGLEAAVRVVREIRDAVGREMDVAIEGHARWNLNEAVRIAGALEEYAPLWLEELTIPDNPAVLARLQAATRTPVCASERLFTRFGFRPLLEQNAARILIPDVAWTGGITELRKIAALADTWLVPLAPHNAGGPVSFAANLHVCSHIPNFMILESVRSFYLTYFPELLAEPLDIAGGTARAPVGPGLGVALRLEVFQRPDAVRRRTDGNQRGLDMAASGDPWAGR